MSVNPAVPKEMNHSTSELRFLNLEVGLKKQEELAKTVENLTKLLNEKVRKLLIKLSVLHLIIIVP